MCVCDSFLCPGSEVQFILYFGLVKEIMTHHHLLSIWCCIQIILECVKDLMISYTLIWQTACSHIPGLECECFPLTDKSKVFLAECWKTLNPSHVHMNSDGKCSLNKHEWFLTFDRWLGLWLSEWASPGKCHPSPPGKKSWEWRRGKPSKQLKKLTWNFLENRLSVWISVCPQFVSQLSAASVVPVGLMVELLQTPGLLQVAGEAVQDPAPAGAVHLAQTLLQDLQDQRVWNCTNSSS